MADNMTEKSDTSNEATVYSHDFDGVKSISIDQINHDNEYGDGKENDSVNDDSYNDNSSVVSDIQTITSHRSNMKPATKAKSTATIQKLKHEIFILKECLEKANSTDITMLQTKVRGYQTDMQRLRQHNSELKDRVQLLEQRVFDLSKNMKPRANANANSDNSTKNELNTSHEVMLETIYQHNTGGFGEKTANTNTNPSTNEDVQLTTSTVSEDFNPSNYHLNNNTTKVTTGTHKLQFKSLLSRCQHLTRLNTAYETKVAMLQVSNYYCSYHNN